MNTVGERFFETMGIPIVKGRPLTDEDKAGGTKAVVVNETMAKKFWPNDDAIGKRFRFFADASPGRSSSHRPDSRYGFLGEDPQPYIYEAHSQRYGGNHTLIVRTATDPAPLVRAVENELRAMDRDLPLLGLATVQKRSPTACGRPGRERRSWACSACWPSCSQRSGSTA